MPILPISLFPECQSLPEKWFRLCVFVLLHQILAEQFARIGLVRFLVAAGGPIALERALPDLLRARSIRLALDVSHPYATNIRRGTAIPHPRHWVALADLACSKSGRVGNLKSKRKAKPEEHIG